MTHQPISWTERLREWSWPWFPVFVLGAILFLVYLYFFPLYERADRAECKRLYLAAYTLADTLRVDATVPFNQSGDGGINCGQRRRLNEFR